MGKLLSVTLTSKTNTLLVKLVKLDLKTMPLILLVKQFTHLETTVKTLHVHLLLFHTTSFHLLLSVNKLLCLPIILLPMLQWVMVFNKNTVSRLVMLLMLVTKTRFNVMLKVVTKMDVLHVTLVLTTKNLSLPNTTITKPVVPPPQITVLPLLLLDKVVSGFVLTNLPVKLKLHSPQELTTCTVILETEKPVQPHFNTTMMQLPFKVLFKPLKDGVVSRFLVIPAQVHTEKVKVLQVKLVKIGLMEPTDYSVT